MKLLTLPNKIPALLALLRRSKLCQRRSIPVGATSLIITLSFFNALASQAEQTIYQVVDDDGHITYTDKPPVSGSESTSTVSLSTINISVPPAKRERIQAPPTEPERSYEVSVTSPPENTTIPMGPGNFSVDGQVSPRLTDGDQVQLVMNGTAVGEPQNEARWSLTGVLRGAHDFSIQVVDTEKTVISESRPVRVYVLRPSTLYR